MEATAALLLCYVTGHARRDNARDKACRLTGDGFLLLLLTLLPGLLFRRVLPLLLLSTGPVSPPALLP